eukprot:SM000099S25246  [mRNA]  locus=s99:418900:420057:- [translate_table: standard]
MFPRPIRPRLSRRQHAPFILQRSQASSSGSVLEAEGHSPGAPSPQEGAGEQRRQLPQSSIRWHDEPGISACSFAPVASQTGLPLHCTRAAPVCWLDVQERAALYKAKLQRLQDDVTGASARPAAQSLDVRAAKRFVEHSLPALTDGKLACLLHLPSTSVLGRLAGIVSCLSFSHFRPSYSEAWRPSPPALQSGACTGCYCVTATCAIEFEAVSLLCFAEQRVKLRRSSSHARRSRTGATVVKSRSNMREESVAQQTAAFLAEASRLLVPVAPASAMPGSLWASAAKEEGRAGHDPMIAGQEAGAVATGIGHLHTVVSSEGELPDGQER